MLNLRRQTPNGPQWKYELAVQDKGGFSQKGIAGLIH